MTDMQTKIDIELDRWIVTDDEIIATYESKKFVEKFAVVKCRKSGEYYYIHSFPVGGVAQSSMQNFITADEVIQALMADRND